ncbi:MAG: hypothetical protein J6Z41_08105 [Prevotella sp.]|nr:hypothetical protein [Prevotella sp.]
MKKFWKAHPILCGFIVAIIVILICLVGCEAILNSNDKVQEEQEQEEEARASQGIYKEDEEDIIGDEYFGMKKGVTAQGDMSDEALEQARKEQEEQKRILEQRNAEIKREAARDKDSKNEDYSLDDDIMESVDQDIPAKPAQTPAPTPKAEGPTTEPIQ